MTLTYNLRNSEESHEFKVRLGSIAKLFESPANERLKQRSLKLSALRGTEMHSLQFSCKELEIKALASVVSGEGPASYRMAPWTVFPNGEVLFPKEERMPLPQPVLQHYIFTVVGLWSGPTSQHCCFGN